MDEGINLMKITGYVRKLDVLGRITVPSELRRQLYLEERDSVEIFLDKDNQIIMRKYEPFDFFTGEDGHLVEFKGKKISKSSIIAMAELAGLRIIKDYT